MKTVIQIRTMEMDIRIVIKRREMNYVVKVSKVKTVVNMRKMKRVLKKITRAEFKNNIGSDDDNDNAD